MSKLQDSVQLQTGLAMYEKENIRNNGHPSYSRLKTAVRRHIDEVMRTRNFRARNEIAERGAVTKSQKGREGTVERKVGKCHQWKAIGQCSKGATRSTVVLSCPGAKAQTDGKIPSKGSSSGGKPFLDERPKNVQRFSQRKAYESVM